MRQNGKALPIAELKEDGYFYLDGYQIRGVQAYKLEGIRIPAANQSCTLTLKILVDPKLLINCPGNYLSGNITNDTQGKAANFG